MLGGTTHTRWFYLIESFRRLCRLPHSHEALSPTRRQSHRRDLSQGVLNWPPDPLSKKYAARAKFSRGS
jgi:hypothetical protein